MSGGPAGGPASGWHGPLQGLDPLRLPGLARSADLGNWDQVALCRWADPLVWLGLGPSRAWAQASAGRCCALPQCHMRPDIRSARGPRPGSCQVCCSPVVAKGGSGLDSQNGPQLGIRACVHVRTTSTAMSELVAPMSAKPSEASSCSHRKFGAMADSSCRVVCVLHINVPSGTSIRTPRRRISILRSIIGTL